MQNLDVDSPIVVGLDISTKTGVAAVEFTPDGPVVRHTSRVTETGAGMDRAIPLAAKILRQVNIHTPTAVFLEGYGFGNKHSLATLVEVGTLVRYGLIKCGYAYGVVTPNSLKKFATGKGNANKDQMRLAVYKRWGIEAPTNDEIDALALAMCGGAFFGKLPMPKVNQSALDSVTLTSNII